MNKYSSYQFAFFRIYLGAYIFFMILFSIPSSAELWSNKGIVSNPQFNLTYGVFPNLLSRFDAPFEVNIFLVLLLILSLMLIAGIYRQLAAVMLWYGWACLVNRNNLITNPAIPYTGWLLLACAVIPGGESISLSKKDNAWYMPALLFNTAWGLFALGYFLSGFDKLFSASWYNGTALKKILDCPLAFNYTPMITDNFPAWLMKISNWFVIGIEMTVLPLAIFIKTRKWSWLIATALQFGILLSLNIAPIVFGMLSMHLFLFDITWFKSTKETLKSFTQRLQPSVHLEYNHSSAQ